MIPHPIGVFKRKLKSKNDERIVQMAKRTELSSRRCGCRVYAFEKNAALNPERLA